MLRILRLHLIPAPRVIAPGPATEFPVMYVDSNGAGRVVHSLDEARALSSAVAGCTRDEGARDFFCEVLPIRHSARVRVSGLSGEWHGPSDNASERERSKAVLLGVRVTYALGLNHSLVTIGFGPGGPWVVHVEPEGPGGVWGLDDVRGPNSPIKFLGAKAEYIAVDPRSGTSLNRFFEVLLTTKGELVPPSSGEASQGSDGSTPPASYMWLSSPLPRRGMPLSTKFMFQGEPTSSFLRALDRSVAVLGMLSSRPGQARERHGLGEGLLGSYRYTGRGFFEYTTVPSLLGSPRAMKRLCEAVSKEALRYSEAKLTEVCGEDRNQLIGPSVRPDAGAGDTGRAGRSKEKSELWTSHLEVLYRWQRAYYHADRSYFREVFGIEAEDLEGLTEDDFRPSWGLYAPIFNEACVTVGRSIGSGGPEELKEHVVLEAGARQARVKRENVLCPDPLDEDFVRGSPAWAPATLVRPNPAAARMLALPEDAVLRADVTPGGDHLRIGPVIGIMAPVLSKGGRFGVETDRFRHMVRLGAELGLLIYVFFPDVLRGEGPVWDPSAGVLRGWTYRDRRGWQQGLLPVPDVVYDRYIPASTGGARDVAGDFSRAFPQAAFVNSLPLVRLCRDKLKTHEVLSGIPEIARHLPYTEAVREPQDAVRFASSRQRSFMKLRFGTGTKGLLLIENLGSRYRITRREKGIPPRIDEVRGQGGLFRFLTDVIRVPATENRGKREEESEYIIQEGIDLAPLPREAGSAFEVRVVYQKGGAGVWLRTGMVVRANPESERFVVPGVELHHRVGDILELALPGKENEVKAEVRRVARMIPPALEGRSGPGGELSVDLGIDKEGKPWLIEVNSKPATLFRDIGAFGLRRLSLLRVLNYAVTLHRGLQSS